MNLLDDEVNVKKTEGKIKLTINGETKMYPVYNISLDALFYNDKNDRIATWISKYKNENNLTSLDMSDKAAYNDIIEKFIVDSDKKYLDNTKHNISLVGQLKPGVVLTDGRIVDGNRRFTCLRQLKKENSRFQGFEAVILNQNYKNDAKQIKMLELMLQHGEDEKVSYNPIDRLVGVYQDIEETKLLSIKEYADSTNETEQDVKKRLEVAKLLVEFLETINAPKQYYIARELKLDGPLNELAGILNKERDEERRNFIKMSAFTNFVAQPDKDMTRFIRNMKDIVKSDYKDSFLEKQMEIAAKVIDNLPEPGHVDNITISKIRLNDDLKDELKHSMTKSVEQARMSKTIHQNLIVMEKVLDVLDDFNMELLEKSPDKNEIGDDIKLIKEKLDTIEKLLYAH